MRVYWVIIGLFCLSLEASVPESPWECDDAQWIGSPGMHDGIFHSARGTVCRIQGNGPKSFAALKEAILSTINEKSEVHTSPIQIRVDGMNGISLEVTNTVEDSGSPVKIREEVQIISDEKTRFIYRTQSKRVEAHGMASYLRKVGFSTELRWRPDAGKFDIVLNNNVQVERPWYALAPLFVLIAKGISEDKFERASTELLDYISKNL
ncbi:MAG: hypothetical protein R3B54_06510 [Bdellovibrionota bacterium]